MRIDEAQAVARAWVEAHDFASLPVVGSFLAGSTLEADPADELAPESDVDVALVVDGPAPPKLGKFDVRGVRVEVTYLAWSELADPERVARVPHLAPSFAPTVRCEPVLTDPDGRLGRLRAEVAPLVGRPEVVQERCEVVLARMADPARVGGSWPEAVTHWLFPTSLSTHVVLVAAGRNPTVRLRYLRARDVLVERGRGEVYPDLLTQLGCREATPRLVEKHLRSLTEAFDAATAAGPTSFFFASDVTPAARPVAVGGTAAMVERGEHREAVFWLVATFARCLQILDATAALDRERHHRAFAGAVADLLGLRTLADLAERRAGLRATLPQLRRLGQEIVAESSSLPARWPTGLDHGRLGGDC